MVSFLPRDGDLTEEELSHGNTRVDSQCHGDGRKRWPQNDQPEGSRLECLDHGAHA
jgi:hypothetical protein